MAFGTRTSCKCLRAKRNPAWNRAKILPKMAMMTSIAQNRWTGCVKRIHEGRPQRMFRWKITGGKWLSMLSKETLQHVQRHPQRFTETKCYEPLRKLRMRPCKIDLRPPVIIPRRYFCGGSFCFMSWCLKFFCLCFHIFS